MMNESLNRSIIIAVLAAVSVFALFVIFSQSSPQPHHPQKISGAPRKETQKQLHSPIIKKTKKSKQASRHHDNIKIVANPFLGDALDPSFFLSRQEHRLEPNQYPYEQLNQSHPHLFTLPLLSSYASNEHAELMFDVDLFQPDKTKNTLLILGNGQPITFQHLGYAKQGSLIHHFTLQYFNRYDLSDLKVISLLKHNKQNIIDMGYHQLSSLPKIQDGYIVTSHGTHLSAHYIFMTDQALAAVNVVSVPLRNVATKRGNPVEIGELQELFAAESNELISIQLHSDTPIEINIS